MYGRNYYTRYDYEECDSDGCAQLMQDLETLVTSNAFLGRKFVSETKCYVVKLADNFSYQDSIDHSRAVNQVFNNFTFPTVIYNRGKVW